MCNIASSIEFLRSNIGMITRKDASRKNPKVDFTPEQMGAAKANDLK